MAYQVETPHSRGSYDFSTAFPDIPPEDSLALKNAKISWGAILAGAALALVAQLVLNMLGIGIGAATLDPTSTGNPSATSLSVGAGIWFAVSGILAALLGGYAAGRLAGKPEQTPAGWHGLIAWAVSTLVIFYLLTTAVGSIVGGTLSTMASVATTASSVVQTSASKSDSGDSFSAIEDALRQGTGSAGLSDATVSAVRTALTGTEEQSGEAREQAAQAIAQSQSIPIEQARTQVAQYEQQYQDAKQTATQVAETATNATSTAALFGAISLILGAVAAWFGGRTGAADPTFPVGSRRLR